MVIMACHFCGNDFEAKTVRKKWCSFDCNSRAMGPDCSRCGERMHRRKNATSAPVCWECRTARAHGTVAEYFRGCRCEPCRGAKKASMDAYTAQRTAGGNPLHKAKPTVDAVCAECGAQFRARLDQVKVGGGRFCSRACNSASQRREPIVSPEVRERHRVHGKHGSVRWRALRRARAALELSGGKRVFVQGACVVCGGQFTGIGAAARYCSDVCSEKNKSGGFGVRFLDRMWIYSRDNFECHLCGTPVDMSADDLDPAAATLDHIVPQAHGGGHELENLATAHRLCNSFRRDIPLAEFLTDETVQELRCRLGVSHVASGCGRV